MALTMSKVSIQLISPINGKRTTHERCSLHLQVSIQLISPINGKLRTAYTALRCFFVVSIQLISPINGKPAVGRVPQACYEQFPFN